MAYFKCFITEIKNELFEIVKLFLTATRNQQVKQLYSSTNFIKHNVTSL